SPCVYLSHLHRAHRAPRSFPTRRSSDLFAMTVDRFDRRVSEAILYHHERYDGRGYPFGLSGMEIPLLARIVLVADAFDAMVSHRDRKSTRLNSSHVKISYAVFCLNKKNG